jgi:hypothetical protein
MARRKNTKFIDPRYFMDEKAERLDEGSKDLREAYVFGADPATDQLKTKINRAWKDDPSVQSAPTWTVAKAWLIFLVEEKGATEEKLKTAGATHLGHYGQYWDEFSKSNLYKLATKPWTRQQVQDGAYKELVGPTATEVLQNLGT